MVARELTQPDCAIEQAAAVIGDWWSLLLLRDIAGGVHRFDQLRSELHISTKVLSERLRDLVTDDVLERRCYSQRPPRYEYHFTERGRGLIPVLIALQSWGAQHILGDGTLTATTSEHSAEALRVHELVGRRVPPAALPSDDGGLADPVSGASQWTVLYCFPAAFAPGHAEHSARTSAIPGAQGCTLESTTYRDRHDAFVRLDVTIHGISTQLPDQQSAFSAHTGLPFTLLSDVNLAFAAALRLPTVHIGGTERLKRLTLIVDRDRIIRRVHYPNTDPVQSVDSALHELADLDRELTRRG